MCATALRCHNRWQGIACSFLHVRAWVHAEVEEVWPPAATANTCDCALAAEGKRRPATTLAADCTQQRTCSAAADQCGRQQLLETSVPCLSFPGYCNQVRHRRAPFRCCYFLLPPTNKLCSQNSPPKLRASGCFRLGWHEAGSRTAHSLLTLSTLAFLLTSCRLSCR